MSLFETEEQARDNYFKNNRAVYLEEPISIVMNAPEPKVAFEDSICSARSSAREGMKGRLTVASLNTLTGPKIEIGSESPMSSARLSSNYGNSRHLYIESHRPGP